MCKAAAEAALGTSGQQLGGRSPSLKLHGAVQRFASCLATASYPPPCTSQIVSVANLPGERHSGYLSEHNSSPLGSQHSHLNDVSHCGCCLARYPRSCHTLLSLCEDNALHVHNVKYKLQHAYGWPCTHDQPTAAALGDSNSCDASMLKFKSQQFAVECWPLQGHSPSSSGSRCVRSARRKQNVAWPSVQPSRSHSTKANASQQRCWTLLVRVLHAR